MRADVRGERGSFRPYRLRVQGQMTQGRTTSGAPTLPYPSRHGPGVNLCQCPGSSSTFFSPAKIDADLPNTRLPHPRQAVCFVWEGECPTTVSHASTWRTSLLRGHDRDQGQGTWTAGWLTVPIISSSCCHMLLKVGEKQKQK